MLAISVMVPHAFVTNLRDGDTVQASAEMEVRELVFGGDSGVKAVDVSFDGGATWRKTGLGRDEGKHNFRRWQARMMPAAGIV